MALWKRNHRIRSAQNDQSEVNISLVFLATRKSGWLAILALRSTFREMEIRHANDYKFLNEGGQIGIAPRWFDESLLLLRLRMRAASPANPVPISNNVAGSGTGAAVILILNAPLPIKTGADGCNPNLSPLI